MSGGNRHTGKRKRYSELADADFDIVEVIDAGPIDQLGLVKLALEHTAMSNLVFVNLPKQGWIGCLQVSNQTHRGKNVYAYLRNKHEKVSSIDVSRLKTRLIRDNHGYLRVVPMETVLA